MDQRMGSLSCKTKSNRWTIPAFAYILDVCRVNASTILALNAGVDPRKQKAYDFGMDLALNLIRPHVQRRSLCGLQSTIRYKISLILGNEAATVPLHQAATSSSTSPMFSPKSETRKRCRVCMSDMSGPGHKKRKDEMTKSKNQCQMCGKPTCLQHTVQICSKCSPQTD